LNVTLLSLLVLVPTALGALAFVVREARVALMLLLAVAAFHLVGTIWLWIDRPVLQPGALIGLDLLGLLVLSITSVLFLGASSYSVPYLLGQTHDEPSGVNRFVPCLLWFLAAMTLVALARNLALLWAAIEATTLASAPLIYFYRRKEALEAAWKYLLICSVGIALALLATFFLGIAGLGSSGGTPDLSLDELVAAAPRFSRPWLEAAFVFALVGYGSKMGLAPLHTWLPDAHSQAPSPVSALLSGALLNCALLGILRFFQVCLASGDAGFARTLLLALGFGSLGMAAVFLVRQRDYKRLLAYSSIENMGIIAIGVGLGGGAAFGALLHTVNHSLAKGGLFLVAGNVLRAFGTTRAREVHGVVRRLPTSGVLLLVLVFALGGAPPFGLFLSELLIFLSAMHAGHVLLAALFVSLLAVAFLGIAGTILPMVQDAAPEEVARVRESPLSIGAPILFAGGVLLLGIYPPPFLSDLLRAAAALIGGAGLSGLAARG
jgi:hydrogenase-4 component F